MWVCLQLVAFLLVMPLLHEKSNISCQLRGTGYFGYLKWDGGSPTIALLVDIPRHAKVEKGMIAPMELVKQGKYSPPRT